MFHYRPVLLNNRVRIFVALIAAITFHVSFMNWQFSMPQFSVPMVSLPRSVNVFLNQGSRINERSNRPPTEQTGQKREDKILVPEQQKAKMLPFKESPAMKNRAKATESSPEMEQIELEDITVPGQDRKPSAADGTVTEQQAADTVQPILPEMDLKTTGQGNVQSKIDQDFDQTAEPEPSGTIRMAYPRYRLNPMVPYPGLARKRGQEGTVILRVLISREGRVDDLDVETTSGYGLLDRAAVSAVKNWSFEPGRKDGKKIAMWVRVPVTFQLK
jgi:periplasmic protein TonB